MMTLNSVFIVLIAGVFLINCASAHISCSRCTGPYVNGIDGTECVTVVKQKCAGMSGRTTGSWIRGIRVLDNCNSIPTGTAIATFFGPGQTYNGGSYKHAGVFIRCEAGGIRIHDQWNGSGGCPFPGTLPDGRKLRAGESSSNGAENMWTIV